MAEDQRAVDALLREFDQNRADRQETVITSLVEIGPAAVSGLIQRLSPTAELELRQRAAVTLGRFGPAANDAVTALIRAMLDRNRSMQNATIKALKQINPNWLTSPETQATIPMLIEQLGSRSPVEIQNIAKLVLTHLGSLAVPDLIRTLSNSEDDLHQSLAAETLGAIGPAAASAVSPLNQALSSEHLHVRRLAAEALGRIGTASEPAVGKLLQALEDQNLAVRGTAAKALAQIETAVEVAAPAVFQLLADKSDVVRQDAVEALVAMGPAPLPLIIELLEAPHIHQLLQGRLKEFEQNFANYQSWLQRQYDNKDELLSRQEAANIDWHRRELMTEFTPEFAATIRLAAVQILHQLGALPQAQAAVPSLLAVLSDQHADVREAAANALAEIRPESTAALTSLMHALRDRQESVCQAAEDALTAIEPEWRSTPMADNLIQSLIEEIQQGHSAAGPVLTRLGSAAVPELVILLQDQRRLVRESVTDLLGQMGPAAESAIPALEDVAHNDANGLVRRAADRALAQIRKR